METQPTRASAKDFFINMGAIVALYTLVYSLINLLFTVINKAYPKIVEGYDYMGSRSISWPVATIIITFPIFIVLMWLLEKDYKMNPEKQNSGVHKWLSFITLFLSGLLIAGDLVTILYYFLDGQELTTGFLLKVLVLLIIAFGIFSYYLSDVLGKLTATSRKIYRVVALVIIVGSIVWGFVVLGSPRAQRLIKYDEQKVSDLQNINNQVTRYYTDQGVIKDTLKEMFDRGDYYPTLLDRETQQPYEYKKTSEKTYELCAQFNKASDEKNSVLTIYDPYGGGMWMHPAGHYCFKQTLPLVQNDFFKPLPMQLR